jgi:hypothetical protein
MFLNNEKIDFNLTHHEIFVKSSDVTEGFSQILIDEEIRQRFLE